MDKKKPEIHKIESIVKRGDTVMVMMQYVQGQATPRLRATFFEVVDDDGQVVNITDICRVHTIITELFTAMASSDAKVVATDVVTRKVVGELDLNGRTRPTTEDDTKTRKQGSRREGFKGNKSTRDSENG